MLGNTVYKFWCIIYKSHFGHVNMHERCLFWDAISTGIYKKLNFNCLPVFSYFYCSVNCMSWVCKLYNIFQTFSETEEIFILEGF